MDAGIATVNELLVGKSVFLIPHFQRGYSWREKHWARLWSDVLAISDDVTGRKHFIGSLVCAATTPVAGESLTRFQVIDGQQRLTTLSILFGALRDVAAELGHGDMATQLGADFLVHVHRRDTLRYKLSPRTGDRAVWQKLVDKHAQPQADPSGIDEAWSWFCEQVRAVASRNGIAALQRLRDAAGQRLAFVSITIADENPYRVFESLNTTGLALTEFDLVRNHLFMKVAIAEQEQFDAAVWGPFERGWKEVCEDPELVGRNATAFFRHFLMRKAGRFNKGETFQQFRTWCDEQRDKSPEQILAVLSRHAGYAVRMLRAERLRDRRQGGADDADWPAGAIDRRLLQLAYCDAATTTPLILELFDRRHQKQIDDEELLGCLQDLVSFLFRRSIAGEKTKQYDKRFADVARDLGTPVRRCLQDALHRIGWPTDSVVLASLRTFPLYSSDRSKARLILEELERAYREREQVRLAPLQIEHVLPQTLSGADGREWKAMLGDGWRDDHERLVHTLGNLTLTGFNQNMSNKAFAAKQRTLKASKLVLNEAFHAIRRWDAERIEARGRLLGSDFLRRFPVLGEPPAIEEEIEEKSQRADRNREFWRKVADRIAILDPGSPSGNPSGLAFLDLPTSFRCLKVRACINRKRATIGVMASFVGKEGDRRFATVSAGRRAIEARFGAPLAESLRSKGRAPDFHFERPAADLETALGESAATEWLAQQASRLRSAMEPSMQEAGARHARPRNTELHLLRKRWFQQLLERARLKTNLHATRTAGVETWVAATSGVAGIVYTYIVGQQKSRVELYIGTDSKDPERPKRRFDWLATHRRDIAKQLPNLVWLRLDGKEASRLSLEVKGGYRAPEADWPQLHDELIEQMIRLHATMQPLIQRIDVERI